MPKRLTRDLLIILASYGGTYKANGVKKINILNKSGGKKMGYYFVDEEDGYKREFDDNKRFIPNENVAAFAAGPGFDWSTLKQNSKNEREQNDDEHYEKVNTKASASSNLVPASIRRAAQVYAMSNREQTSKKTNDDINSSSLNAAREAYVAYRKDEKLIPKEMAGSGIYTGSSKQVSRSYARYQEALERIKKNMDDWTAKFNTTAEGQEEKDIKEYIARWKQQRG